MNLRGSGRLDKPRVKALAASIRGELYEGISHLGEPFEEGFAGPVRPTNTRAADGMGNLRRPVHCEINPANK